MMLFWVYLILFSGFWVVFGFANPDGMQILDFVFLFLCFQLFDCIFVMEQVS